MIKESRHTLAAACRVGFERAGHVQGPQPIRAGLRPKRGVKVPDQHGAAKCAPRENISILLQRIAAAAGEHPDFGGGLRRDRLGNRGGQVALGKPGQIELRRPVYELAERAWRIVGREKLAEDVGGRLFGDARGLAAHHVAVRIRCVRGPGDVVQDRAGPNDPLMRRALASCMLQADATHHVPQMPARQHVIADDGHTGIRQMSLADRENRILCGPRHPTEHAVANDVVEQLIGWPCYGNVGLPYLDVAQPESRNPPAAGLDVPARQVETEEPCLWILRRKRNDIAARCTAKLEHACAIGIGRRETMHRRQRRETRGLAVSDGHRDIRQKIVVTAFGLIGLSLIP